jgi:hypothetical protein
MLPAIVILVLLTALVATDPMVPDDRGSRD